MKESFLGKSKIEYSIKRNKKIRQMRIVVYCDGRVVVTVPYGVNSFVIQKFIDDKNEWILKKIDFFQQNNCILTGLNSKSDYLKNKNKALALVENRIEYFNKNNNFSYKTISIKNQKTRWGSCSSKGNLNFNYKILFLPEKIRDYIIVHELCHLKEFNHSKRFWTLVESFFPDYVEIRDSLKKYRLF